MKPNQVELVLKPKKPTGFPHPNNIGTNLTSKERENFALIIGLASWAGAATFGLLAAVALLAYIARRENGRRATENQPEFVICTREESGAEVTRL